MFCCIFWLLSQQLVRALILSFQHTLNLLVCLNVQTKQYSKNFYGYHQQSVYKIAILFQVTKQCQKISAFFLSKSLDDPCYSQWLRKKSDEAALCSYCKSFYVFNSWYSCFYFYIFIYCTALLKAVSFVDLNPLGACIAEKQQSDEKLSKRGNKQRLIMWRQPR